MYYEEKLIDGVLHCRGTPDGEWTPFTLAMYERRRVQDAKRLERLEAALREIVDTPRASHASQAG